MTFAEALIASRAEEFPEVGATVGRRAREFMYELTSWLDANEPPESLEAASWGNWLGDTFTSAAPAHISDDLDHILAIADDAVEPGVSLDR